MEISLSTSEITSTGEAKVREQGAATLPLRATSTPNFALTFLLTLIACCLILPIICLAWVNYYRDPGAGWCEILYRQKRIIADRRAHIPTRILIVGGSSTLFGIDAELIEKKLNVPTINLGTHAGLGLRYLLDRATRLARPGDIILLSPEYETWNDTYRDTPGIFLNYVWTYDKPYLRHLAPKEIATLLWNIPLSDYSDSLSGWLDRINGRQFHFENTADYCPATLSESGDIRVDHLPRPQTFPQVALPLAANYSAQTLDAVGEFCRSANQRGIKVMLTWPQFAKPADTTLILNVPESLVTSLLSNGITILDTPEQNAYPSDWFMDTAYHCDPCCRRIRTEALIQRLRQALKLQLPIPQTKKTCDVFLLAAGSHRLAPGNIFADQPDVQFRYLGPQPTTDPRAITIPEVAALVAQGKDVETDSPDAVKMLSAAHVPSQPISIDSTTSSEWMDRYPDASIVLAGPSEGAMVLDPGRHARCQSLLPLLQTKPLEFSLSSLANHHSAVPCEISVSLDSTKTVSIAADARVFVSSGEGNCNAVVDPELGIIQDTQVFQGTLPAKIWELDQILSATSAHPGN
jgi:hypothetical protein